MRKSTKVSVLASVLSLGGLVFGAEPVRKGPARADTLIKSAKNLEYDWNREGAIEFYEMVVLEYYGTTQATAAARRIKELGGTVPVVSVADRWSPEKEPPKTVTRWTGSGVWAKRKVRYPAQDWSLLDRVIANGVNQALQGEQMRLAAVYRAGSIYSYLPASTYGGGSALGYSGSGSGSVHVNGYFRANGTYVHSYYRSAPSR